MTTAFWSNWWPYALFSFVVLGYFVVQIGKELTASRLQRHMAILRHLSKQSESCEQTDLYVAICRRTECVPFEIFTADLRRASNRRHILCGIESINLRFVHLYDLTKAGADFLEQRDREARGLQ